MTKIIVTSNDSKIIDDGIPIEWGNNYEIITPQDFINLESINHYNINNIYVCTDNDYDIVSQRLDNPSCGFSKHLSDLCNYNLTQNTNLNYIDYDDQLIPNFCVTGYICNNKIGILSIWDYIYNNTENLQTLQSIKYPSSYKNNCILINEYRKIMRELFKIINCNNIIIDIEFLLHEDEIHIVKIRPMIIKNKLPIYENVTGYNILLSLERLRKGLKPIRTIIEKKGIIIPFHNLTLPDGTYIHTTGIFTIIEKDYSYSYGYSYTKDLDILYDLIKNNTKYI